MKLFLLLLCAAIASAEEYRAVANLTDPEGKNTVKGNLTFVQIDDGNVLLTGTITGLEHGKHGFHVHEKGDIVTSCTDSGAHYNPFNKTHGGPQDINRHVGDLGNIEAGVDGVAHINITDSIIKLTGANSILDRAIVVHADEDDLGKKGFSDSLTTGHAGNRLACGKIVNNKMLHNGSNHGTSESTTEMQQGRLANISSESKTVSEPSGSAPLFTSWFLVILLSAALHIC